MANAAVWDPFWFMREMLRWGSSSPASGFDVEETKDAYVCKAKLALPDQADAHHVKAALDNGELTLVVPKAPPQPRASRKTRSGHGSAGRTARPSARRSRRG